MDMRLVFGAVNGTMLFQRCSDAIRFMLQEDGIHVWNYIDDTFTAVESVGSEEKFHTICDLITSLGLPLNADKVAPPDTRMDIMGIFVDVENKILTIPENKMKEVIECVESFVHKRIISKRELQSLIGKLVYISKVIKPA